MTHMFIQIKIMSFNEEGVDTALKSLNDSNIGCISVNEFNYEDEQYFAVVTAKTVVPVNPNYKQDYEVKMYDKLYDILDCNNYDYMVEEIFYE